MIKRSIVLSLLTRKEFLLKNKYLYKIDAFSILNVYINTHRGCWKVFPPTKKKHFGTRVTLRFFLSTSHIWNMKLSSIFFFLNKKKSFTAHSLLQKADTSILQTPPNHLWPQDYHLINTLLVAQILFLQQYLYEIIYLGTPGRAIWYLFP